MVMSSLTSVIDVTIQQVSNGCLKTGDNVNCHLNWLNELRDGFKSYHLRCFSSTSSGMELVFVGLSFFFLYEKLLRLKIIEASFFLF